MGNLGKALSPVALARATGYALEGVRSALKDSSFLRLVFMNIIVDTFFVALLYPMSLVEIITVVTASILPLLTEIVNTSIEDVVDMVKPNRQYHQLAKRAKDRAAGATFMALATQALLLSLVVWYRFM